MISFHETGSAYAELAIAGDRGCTVGGCRSWSFRHGDGPDCENDAEVSSLVLALAPMTSQASDVGTAKNRVTVWFNAWKYESTDQIWAGLADAIVKQVTERLSQAERELFFFRLHLKRLDVAKIRKKITNGILTKLFELVRRWWWLYLGFPAASYLVGHFAALSASLGPLTSIGPLGLILDVAVLGGQWAFANRKELETPAKVEFGDLVSAPEYDAKLGFVHQVTEDLRKTLELVNPQAGRW